MKAPFPLWITRTSKNYFIINYTRLPKTELSFMPGELCEQAVFFIQTEPCRTEPCYHEQAVKWPASCISDSSGVHSFQMAAHSSIGKQSSNVIPISSAVDGSIGGVFSRRGIF